MRLLQLPITCPGVENPKSYALPTAAEEHLTVHSSGRIFLPAFRYNIILLVLPGRDDSLFEFITEQVARLADVQTVERFIVYQGYNLHVPYIL